MKPKEIRETVIVFSEEEDKASISTFNRKWTNRLMKLVEDGHAEEVESTVAGAHEFELSKSMIRIPFFREGREYTEEEREAARERLTAVREAVNASKGKKAKAKAAPAKGKKTGKAHQDIKSKIGPKRIEVEDEDDEDEEEEVKVNVAKKSTKPVAKPAPAKKPVAKGKKAKDWEDETEMDDEDEVEEIDEVEDEDEDDEIVVRRPASGKKTSKKR